MGAGLPLVCVRCMHTLEYLEEGRHYGRSTTRRGLKVAQWRGRCKLEPPRLARPPKKPLEAGKSWGQNVGHGGFSPTAVAAIVPLLDFQGLFLPPMAAHQTRPPRCSQMLGGRLGIALFLPPMRFRDIRLPSLIVQHPLPSLVGSYVQSVRPAASLR